MISYTARKENWEGWGNGELTDRISFPIPLLHVLELHLPTIIRDEPKDEKQISISRKLGLKNVFVDSLISNTILIEIK